MVEKKYPEYVTTDSDLWNSADEAYFYVVKGKAKPFTSIITPIIENAFDTGMIREATEDEINEYLLEQDIEKRIRERRFEPGRTYDDTKKRYFEWKESYDKNNKPKIVEKKEISEDDIEKTIKTTTSQSLPHKKVVTEIKEDDKVIDTIEKEGSVSIEKDKLIAPQQNAINQKPSVSTKSF